MNTRYLPLAGLAATILIAVGCVVQLAGIGTEPRVIEGGKFEASGLASVAGSPGVLFVDDGQNRQVYWMELAADGTQVGAAKPVPLGADVTDPEAITASSTHYYVVGSQSKSTGTDGDGLIRFAFAEANRRVSGLERITGLKAWLTAHVPELKSGAALNIEGLAWDPVGKQLLLGLRSPVVDGQALIIPLGLIDPAGPFTADNLRVNGGKAMRLALGGGSIRSIEYDESAKAFLMIVGDDGGRPSKLVEWNGQSGAAVREVASFPKSLKPEGVASVTLGGRLVRVVVFDTGRVSVLN
jgi:hypothetical protein